MASFRETFFETKRAPPLAGFLNFKAHPAFFSAGAPHPLRCKASPRLVALHLLYVDLWKSSEGYQELAVSAAASGMGLGVDQLIPVGPMIEA